MRRRRSWSNTDAETFTLLIFRGLGYAVYADIGWDGEQTWQTHERDLAVSAVFRSGGHVGPAAAPHLPSLKTQRSAPAAVETWRSGRLTEG
ncbi:DUF6228 family protein [Streptomyces sp. 8N114]|uniref:DUF6228 family protein n=1 Tax=Streptomyces sp. 8N114 TaxID=3457419 RepID=UPI003FD256B6